MYTLTIDEKLKLLAPIIGEKRAYIFRQLYYVEDDLKARKEIECRIDALVSKLVKTSYDRMIILPPPERSQCQGDICIGSVEYLGNIICPFSLRLRDLNRHCLIAGSTGSGKTSVAAKIIKELYHLNIPIIVFDWETSYRALAKNLDRFMVFTVGIDKISPIYFNLFRLPPGIHYEEYAKALVTLVSHDYLGGQGSDTVLLEFLLEAYEKRGTPIFADLVDIIKREVTDKLNQKGKLGGRSGLWKETVLRQNKFMSIGYIGTVLDTQNHYPIDLLLDRWTVFELGNLKSPHDRAFITHYLLNQIMLHFQHKGFISEELKLVIVMEEFHNLINIGKQRTDMPDLIDQLFREIRKYGVGLVCIDQTPSEIPNAIYQNTNIKISFTQNTDKDLMAVARGMNLEPPSFSYVGLLKTGKAIVSVKQHITDSFQINIPEGETLPYINDDELKSLMQRHSENLKEIYRLEQKNNSIRGSPINETPPLDKPFDEIEKQLVIDISSFPYDGVVARRNRLRLTAVQMNNLQQTFINRGYAQAHTIDGTRMLELTLLGKTKAEDHGLHVKPKDVKGGLKHSYGVHLVVTHLSNLGFNPVCERDNIDVTDEESGIALEIETGKSNILGNLYKLGQMTEKYKYQYILGTDKEAEIIIKRLIYLMPHIQVMTVKDFAKLTKEQILSIPPDHQQTLS